MSGGKALRAGMAALGFAIAAAHAADRVDFGAERPSAAARRVAQWAFATADHDGGPFAVVDKKAARIFVFDAAGRLAGVSPVLLGSAPGDDSLPGIGRLDPLAIPPRHRTTPAGRFVAEPGRNIEGEPVVWIDYDAALAIHRLRPGPARERREQRLKSPTPADNRASLGCIVVPVAFYERVIDATLGRRRGVVYVLPETRPPEELFGADLASAP